MRKLIIGSLMLLGLAVSASGQYRIVKLNSSQVRGEEPKADAILVAWDDGEGRHRSSSTLLQGPVQFFTRDSPLDAQGGRDLSKLLPAKQGGSHMHSALENPDSI